VPSHQYLVQTSRGFISTDITQIVVALCKTFEPKRPISIVDYGTGQASLLTMISQVAHTFPQHTFVFVGYDPHLNPNLTKDRFWMHRISIAKGKTTGTYLLQNYPHMPT